MAFRLGLFDDSGNHSIESCLAHRLVGLVSAGEKVRAAARARLEPYQQIERLLAQVDHVRPTGLHAFGWDCPSGRLEINLFPRRLKQFPLAAHAQEDELERQLERGQRPDAIQDSEENPDLPRRKCPLPPLER